jgi:Immunity protein family (Imm11)
MSVNLVFKEDVVGDHHVFRMMYYEANVVCDEKMKLACSAAELSGIGFQDASERR